MVEPPLKNMSSSVGMIISNYFQYSNIWKVIKKSCSKAPTSNEFPSAMFGPRVETIETMQSPHQVIPYNMFFARTVPTWKRSPHAGHKNTMLHHARKMPTTVTVLLWLINQHKSTNVCKNNVINQPLRNGTNTTYLRWFGGWFIIVLPTFIMINTGSLRHLIWVKIVK